MSKNETQEWVAVGCGCAMWLVGLAIVAGVIAVGVHFITKFW